MILAFYKGEGLIGDKVIRFWTSSKYSHVELIIGGVWYSASQYQNKVTKRILPMNKDLWDFVEVKEHDWRKSKEVFKNVENSEYDWLGIFLTQLIPLDRHNKHKYFCSEICAEMLGLENAHRYSPEDLYQYITKGITL